MTIFNEVRSLNDAIRIIDNAHSFMCLAYGPYRFENEALMLVSAGVHLERRKHALWELLNKRDDAARKAQT